MATRLRHQLTDRLVRNAKAESTPYRLTDGDGLYLEVTPKGSKIWRMRAKLNKKEMILTFGSYPALSLADARKNCEDAHTLISQGIDPREAKKEAEAAQKARTDNIFEKIARNWHTSKLPEWQENTAKGTLSMLERDIFPFIGDTPISDITHQQIVDILETMQKRGVTDTAKKAKTAISRVFKYAIQRGIVKYNPVNDLDSVIRITTVKHLATISYKELPGFLKAIDQNHVRMFLSTRITLSLMMLIFLRTSELIEAEWSEIDLEKGVWIVPWQRMKMGKRKINPDKTDHQRGEEPDDSTKIHVPIIVPPPRWHQQKPCAYQHACVTDNG